MSEDKRPMAVCSGNRVIFEDGSMITGPLTRTHEEDGDLIVEVYFNVRGGGLAEKMLERLKSKGPETIVDVPGVRVLTVCPECEGRGVDFKGSGRDTQYRYCSKINEPGHVPSPAEATARVQRVVGSLRGNGRHG